MAIPGRRILDVTNSEGSRDRRLAAYRRLAMPSPEEIRVSTGEEWNADGGDLALPGDLWVIWVEEESV